MRGTEPIYVLTEPEALELAEQHQEQPQRRVRRGQRYDYRKNSHHGQARATWADIQARIDERDANELR